MIANTTMAAHSVLLKKALLVVLVGAVPVAYYAGGVSGFAKGYAAAQFSESAHAGPIVFVLTKLRATDPAAAIGVLEQQLDALIVQNAAGGEPLHSLFNLPGLVGVSSSSSIDKSVASALVYRAEFPSTAQPPVKATVDAAIAKVAKHVREEQ